MAITPTSGIYATPLPIQRSSGLHDSGVRWDDTPTRSLHATRWISPFIALPHRHKHTNRQITQKCRPSRPYSSFENPHFIPSHTHFLCQINHIMSKALSIPISINVQTKSDINLGGQGMVITNQGVAIQPCFQQARQWALLRSHRGLLHKQTNTQSRKRNKSFIVELELEIIKIWSSK